MKSADPQLITPARLVLAYLESKYGEHTLTAMQRRDRRELLLEVTGKLPAILGEDVSGWHNPKWHWIYDRNIRRVVERIAEGWEQDATIPQMAFHWPNPFQDAGTFPATKLDLTNDQWDAIVTEGTPEHDQMLADYRRHMEYLRPLVEADIPILWRPLHEIDGGWFWWTCEHDPSKTAELWRILFRENAKLGFHNLIYVWSSSEKKPRALGSYEAVIAGAVADRVGFYPGSEFVDITGVDLYRWDYRTGERRYWDITVTYKMMYDITKAVDPTKMVALCECQALPNPDPAPEHAGNFAPWLWALPWFYANNQNPRDWMQQVHAHPKYVHALK